MIVKRSCRHNMKTKIIVIFKTHFDIGFTHLAKEVIARYSGKMLQDVINTCNSTSKEESGKRFVWTMSSWPLLQTLKNAGKQDLIEAEKLIKDGQLCTHALPYTTHTEFLGVEELYRSFTFAKEFCDQYEKPYPASAKMTDVPGHTIALVQALSKAGVGFLHLGCNQASNPPDVPLLFWWECKDGSRVLTMYNKGGYGSDILPPKEWEFPVYLSVQQSNDNIGPQTPEVIQNLEEKVKNSGIDAEIEVGTMDDFYREICKCDLSGLPVIKEDLADSWIHGVGTYPKEVATLRKHRKKVAAMEKLLAATSLHAEKEISDIYENALLFGEHTWGLDVKTTLGYDRCYDKNGFLKSLEKASHKRLEESWREQSERVDNVAEKSNLLFEKISNYFHIQKDGKFLCVFNPSNKEYKGYVKINNEENLVDENKSLPCIDGAERYSYVSIPPLSLKYFDVAKNNETVPLKKIENEDEIILDNDVLRVSVSKVTGLITAVACGARKIKCSLGEYTYETVGIEKITSFLRNYPYRYYDWGVNDFGRMNYPSDIETKTYKPKVSDLKSEGNTISVTFEPSEDTSVAEYGNAQKIINTYTLLGNRIEIKTQIVGKQKSPVAEGGHLSFGFDISEPQFYINKSGLVLNLAKDLRKDSNYSNYCLEDYVVCGDQENKMAIISRSCPLFSIGETQIYDYKRTFDNHSECRINFNLFNNMWGTNFPQWVGGDFCFEFTVIPFIDDNFNYYDTNEVLVLGKSDEKKEFHYPFNVNGGYLQSVQKKENTYFLRIREVEGKNNLCKIKTEFGSIEQVDLFERTIKNLGQYETVIELKPYEIVTIKVEETNE